MDQFKKLYKPVLKAVKPGEKRSPPTATKVDFSKRFAEIIHHQDDNSNEENEESIESNIKLKEDVVDFKPASALKLNLNRPGLLSMPQKMDNDHTGNNNHVDSPTSAITIIDQEESSYIKNIQKKEFIEQPSSAIEFPSDSDEDFTEINASNVNNEKKTNIPMITQNDLDKKLLDCRGMLQELESKLSMIESSFPLSLTRLDDEINMLHNLKLDFMLELGST